MPLWGRSGATPAAMMAMDQQQQQQQAHQQHQRVSRAGRGVGYSPPPAGCHGMGSASVSPLTRTSASPYGAGRGVSPARPPLRVLGGDGSEYRLESAERDMMACPVSRIKEILARYSSIPPGDQVITLGGRVLADIETPRSAGLQIGTDVLMLELAPHAARRQSWEPQAQGMQQPRAAMPAPPGASPVATVAGEEPAVRVREPSGREYLVRSGIRDMRYAPAETVLRAVVSSSEAPAADQQLRYLGLPLSADHSVDDQGLSGCVLTLASSNAAPSQSEAGTTPGEVFLSSREQPQLTGRYVPDGTGGTTQRRWVRPGGRPAELVDEDGRWVARSTAPGGSEAELLSAPHRGSAPQLLPADSWQERRPSGITAPAPGTVVSAPAGEGAASVLRVCSPSDAEREYRLTSRRRNLQQLPASRLKRSLETVTGIPADQQVLSYAGRVLGPDQSCETVGVPSGGTLCLTRLGEEVPTNPLSPSPGGTGVLRVLNASEGGREYRLESGSRDLLSVLCGELKQVLADVTGVPPQDQVLSYGGRVLGPQDTLRDLGMTSGDEVVWLGAAADPRSPLPPPQHSPARFAPPPPGGAALTRVCVVSAEGKEFRVEAPDFSGVTIAALKAALHEPTGVHPAEQMLSAGGAPLSDDQLCSQVYRAGGDPLLLSRVSRHGRPSADLEEAIRFRSRCDAFYRHYAPHRLRDPGWLDRLLLQWAGQPEELWNRMVAEYGPWPPERRRAAEAALRRRRFSCPNLRQARQLRGTEGMQPADPWLALGFRLGVWEGVEMAAATAEARQGRSLRAHQPRPPPAPGRPPRRARSLPVWPSDLAPERRAAAVGLRGAAVLPLPPRVAAQLAARRHPGPGAPTRPASGLSCPASLGSSDPRAPPAGCGGAARDHIQPWPQPSQQSPGGRRYPRGGSSPRGGRVTPLQRQQPAEASGGSPGAAGSPRRGAAGSPGVPHQLAASVGSPPRHRSEAAEDFDWARLAVMAESTDVVSRRLRGTDCPRRAQPVPRVGGNRGSPLRTREAQRAAELHRSLAPDRAAPLGKAPLEPRGRTVAPFVPKPQEQDVTRKRELVDQLTMLEDFLEYRATHPQDARPAQRHMPPPAGALLASPSRSLTTSPHRHRPPPGSPRRQRRN
eukprot:TRINITY_DN25705_c0_g1_i1.p1 TRINITY_DN25705_c0_g1~~TRINITY_DN25705_c0_g1_i1.p1  ORF type:complete len:1160 (+),score=188.42 TRINITY_DN25705_c0_g1_i1:87-3482(+)